MQFLAIRLVLAAALTLCQPVRAQPAPAASGVPPSERAQRDADKVFQMILQHADKPRRAVAAPEAKQPAAPAVPAAARATAPAVPAVPSAQAAPGATTSAPPRAPEPRVSASTSPDTPDQPATSTQPDAGRTADAMATPSLGSVAAAAPVAALAPVAVAVPRSLRLELISSVEPEFPSRLVRSLGKGSVVVNFDVRPDGTVARTEVARSSHRGLNEAAQAAVAAWRFRPVSETMPGVVELKFE